MAPERIDEVAHHYELFGGVSPINRLNQDIMAALLAQRWDHLILDEAHALKDPKGNKRTKMICAPDMLDHSTAEKEFNNAGNTLAGRNTLDCIRT